MNFEREILGVLESGTALVAAIADERISPEEFLQQYDNFYYYNALDGHEATGEQAAVLGTLLPCCAFHQQVQDIVNLVYRSEVALPDYEAAGRILPDSAGLRIAVLAKEAGVAELLKSIRDRIAAM